MYYKVSLLAFDNLFPDWQKSWDSWWRDTGSVSGMSPPESIRNSVFSASKYLSKSDANDNVDGDSDDESSSPFLPERATSIDDSFDVVFEASSHKIADRHMDDTTSGGIVFEDGDAADSNADRDVSKKSKKSKFFARANGNQSSLDESSSQASHRQCSVDLVLASLYTILLPVLQESFASRKKTPGFYNILRDY